MTTLTIEVTDRYDCTHKKEIEQAPYESDEAFMIRAAKMLDELRKEVS